MPHASSVSSPASLSRVNQVPTAARKSSSPKSIEGLPGGKCFLTRPATHLLTFRLRVAAERPLMIRALLTRSAASREAGAPSPPQSRRLTALLASGAGRSSCRCAGCTCAHACMCRWQPAHPPARPSDLPTRWTAPPHAGASAGRGPSREAASRRRERGASLQVRTACVLWCSASKHTHEHTADPLKGEMYVTVIIFSGLYFRSQIICNSI